MHFKLDRATLGVAVGTPLNLSDGKGCSLRVLQGRVWLTQEGSLDDVFLSAGETYTFGTARRVVVTAEGGHGAVSTVSFDVPLSIRSRDTDGNWLGYLRHTFAPTALT